MGRGGGMGSDGSMGRGGPWEHGEGWKHGPWGSRGGSMGRDETLVGVVIMTIGSLNDSFQVSRFAF